MAQINIEFTGGLETLFSDKQQLSLQLPGEDYTLGDLITQLATEHVQQDKKHLFILDGGVRPGILVLVNDADWELEGEAEYVLRPGDNVVFVSTLHGG